MDKFFILGASDPEMTLIEDILNKAGVAYGYATLDSVRVHPGNAYKAEGVKPLAGILPPETFKKFVLIECQVGRVDGRSIDHHRPGDPGFGLPAEQYWLGSSIGQICEYLVNKEGGGMSLGEKLSTRMWEYQMVAAADHCLADAYKGKCPGVDPVALMLWRAQTRAEFQKRAISEVLSDIANATEALRSAPKVKLEGVEIADFGNTSVPELPEAAVRTGFAYQAEIEEQATGRRKVVLGGHTTPELVSAWMKSAEERGLTDIYGVPARGFAGGYIPEE